MSHKRSHISAFRGDARYATAAGSKGLWMSSSSGLLPPPHHQVRLARFRNGRGGDLLGTMSSRMRALPSSRRTPALFSHAHHGRGGFMLRSVAAARPLTRRGIALLLGLFLLGAMTLV